MLLCAVATGGSISCCLTVVHVASRTAANDVFWVVIETEETAQNTSGFLSPSFLPITLHLKRGEPQKHAGSRCSTCTWTRSGERLEMGSPLFRPVCLETEVFCEHWVCFSLCISHPRLTIMVPLGQLPQPLDSPGCRGVTLRFHRPRCSTAPAVS